MSENELAEKEQRLAKAEEKFVTVARMIVEASNALTGVLRGNREFFESHRVAFEKTEELMADQIDLLKEIAAGMQTLVKANADTNATVSENSEQMKALLAKVDSYFSTTSGLDYDN